MNIHKVTTSPIVKPRAFIKISKVTRPKYDVTKGNVIIINMQKLFVEITTLM